MIVLYSVVIMHVRAPNMAANGANSLRMVGINEIGVSEIPDRAYVFAIQFIDQFHLVFRDPGIKIRVVNSLYYNTTFRKMKALCENKRKIYSSMNEIRCGVTKRGVMVLFKEKTKNAVFFFVGF